MRIQRPARVPIGYVRQKRVNNKATYGVASDTWQGKGRNRFMGAGGALLPLAQEILQARHNELTHEQKLISTEKRALGLFMAYKEDKNGLMEALRRLGIDVFEGIKDPWVNQVVDKLAGGSPFYVAPNVLAFPHEEEVGDESTEGYPPEFLAFLERAEREGRVAIFIPQHQTGMKTLFHEAFHVLQLLTGLPFGTTLKAEKVANAFKNRFYADLPQVMQLDDLPKPPSSPNPTGAGEAIRIEARREIETIRFLLKYTQLLGLSPEDDVFNQANLKIYQRLFDLSYLLDS